MLVLVLVPMVVMIVVSQNPIGNIIAVANLNSTVNIIDYHHCSQMGAIIISVSSPFVSCCIILTAMARPFI